MIFKSVKENFEDEKFFRFGAKINKKFFGSKKIFVVQKKCIYCAILGTGIRNLFSPASQKNGKIFEYFF